MIREMREAEKQRGRTNELIRPRYSIWENVCGSQSSNKGRDFQTVLTEFVKIAEPESPDVPLLEKGWPHAGVLMAEDRSWSVAWRTHDLQFWGRPQRRRRISVVADYGGDTAAEVLFKCDSGAVCGREIQTFPQGVSRHTESCGTARESAAGGTAQGAGESCERADDVEDYHSQRLVYDARGNGGGVSSQRLPATMTRTFQTSQHLLFLARQRSDSYELGGYRQL